MIEISKVRTDGGTQSRAAINEATVDEYAEAMADPDTVFPPIIVYHDGTDYWLADGFHRLKAWAKIGRIEVPAEIRQGDRRRAILHSVAANGAHGLRRTNDDKRRAALTLLDDEEWGQWSDRQIARQCGVSHEFVRKLRAPSLSTVDSEPRKEASGRIAQLDGEPRAYITKHGTEAKMDTSRIGTPKAAEPAPDPAPISEPEPVAPAEAKLRRELAKLTPAALIDDVVGLKARIADERAKRRDAEAKVADLQEQIDALTADDDMGRKLGLALEKIQRANGRLAETQAQLAREIRRANGFEAECKRLSARLEAQEIKL